MTNASTATIGTPIAFKISAPRVSARLLIALGGAGLFSLLSCIAFYLFEVERLTERQQAALAHYLGQTMRAADLDWRRMAAGDQRALERVRLGWHYDRSAHALTRIASTDQGKRQLSFPLDDAWLATKSGPDMRLFIVQGERVLASSLGEAGAGEASALSPQRVGRLSRHDSLFVQVPQRWDDEADSPLLVTQQRLTLPFSLTEIAAAGLFLWAALAAAMWLTVGLWLNKALSHAHFLAYHDPLTGLINRAGLRIGLVHMIAENRRNKQIMAVFYLDLDRFKIINDSLGHAAGDHVLRETALRLSNCVRDSDFVARLGGDEFVVVVGELSEPNQAATIARKIIDRLATPIDYSGHPLAPECSIGIALHPGSVDNADDLIKQADQAMYAAKQSGRNHYHYYDKSLGIDAERRLALELRLRSAVSHEQFELHYQPVIKADTPHRLSGFEALIRWNDGEHFISPVDFIPVAEETGLIIPIGRWVLREACRQMAIWQNASVVAPEATVSVNVSTRQLIDADFVCHVDEALAASGLATASLILEITESLYMQVEPAILERLQALRRRGIRFAMDDFGTGFSSLASLTQLPLDRIKIDRAFVQKVENSPDKQAIVRTIIAIARQLNLEIVAEGVETNEQSDSLTAYGCHLQQGWLFGKAASPREIRLRFFGHAPCRPPLE